MAGVPQGQREARSNRVDEWALEDHVGRGVGDLRALGNASGSRNLLLSAVESEPTRIEGILKTASEETSATQEQWMLRREVS